MRLHCVCLWRPSCPVDCSGSRFRGLEFDIGYRSSCPFHSSGRPFNLRSTLFSWHFQAFASFYLRSVHPPKRSSDWLKQIEPYSSSASLTSISCMPSATSPLGVPTSGVELPSFAEAAAADAAEALFFFFFFLFFGAAGGGLVRISTPVSVILIHQS